MKAKANCLEKGIRLLLVLLLVSMVIFYSQQNTKYDEVIIKNGIAKDIKPGMVLLFNDFAGMEARDYTIPVDDSNEPIELVIWDFGGEDGDYIQVIVNDTPVTQPFMIFHKPKRIMVVPQGTVKIKGIKDGSGGITYAVHVRKTGETYFNVAPVEGSNTYTLLNSK